MIRVGDAYYMSSTTMHMSPGLPIMKSTGLVDEWNLANGKSTYGRGSWASSLRYYSGTYYVTTFSQFIGLGRASLRLLLFRYTDEQMKDSNNGHASNGRSYNRIDSTSLEPTNSH